MLGQLLGQFEVKDYNISLFSMVSWIFWDSPTDYNLNLLFGIAFRRFFIYNVQFSMFNLWFDLNKILNVTLNIVNWTYIGLWFHPGFFCSTWVSPWSIYRGCSLLVRIHAIWYEKHTFKHITNFVICTNFSIG